MKLRLLALAMAGISTAGTAVAAPYAPFDVRSAGMGGTGVASAKAASAALFNPAMLSAQVEGDKFQFVLGLGATAIDKNNLVDEIDGLQTDLDALDTLITQIDAANIGFDGPANALVMQASGSTAALATRLTAINGNSANVLPGAGIGIGVPGKHMGVGVFTSLNGQLSITPTVDQYDINRLNALSGIAADGIINGTTERTATALDSTGTAQPLFVPGALIDVASFDSASTATAVGVAVGEVGVALSRQFALEKGVLNAGVTPKMLNVVTYEYNASTENFDQGDITNFEQTDSGFDVDVGVVYKSAEDSPWQFGVVAKNLIGGDYNTIAGRKIELGTQLRAGVARMTNRTTVSLDVDLLENAGTTGNNATQFVALGAEYDLKMLQLRGGYRANLAGGDVADSVTAGIGLGPVDISAMVSDGSVGAFMQIGFGW